MAIFSALRLLRASTLLTAMAVLPFAATAACPTAANEFTVQVGDVNGDGILDYGIVPQPLFIPLMLDDDLLIPVPVSRGHAGFMLLSRAGNDRLLQTLSDGKLPTGSWAPSGQQLMLANTMGSGCGALVLKGVASVGSSATTDIVLIRLPADGQSAFLMQVLTTPANGYGLSAGELQVAKVNGDGRDDLVHRVDGLVQGVYLANGAGQVSLDVDATVISTWNDFVAAAGARDARARRYLSSDVIDRFGEALTVDALREMAQGVKGVGVARRTEQQVMVTVQRSGPDGDALYTIGFGRTADGGWRIALL